MKIVLVCLLWVAEVFGQCGEEWYGEERRTVYRTEDYPSVEERAPSFEEVSEEYYPVKQQRSLRSSRYSPPAYGYGNSFRQDSDDWERYEGPRKSHYDVHKSRRKYDLYGKSSRSDYSIKGSLGVNAYERKKTSRAAKYGVEGGSHGKTTSLTYKAVPPKASCAQNLLIGCTPTVTRVPCSASSSYDTYGHSGGVPYYPSPPAYHHAPAHQMPSHYGMPYPGTYPTYGPPPPSASPYYPPSSAPHGAPTAHQKDHPASDLHAKPSEDAHGYGPSYKVATPEEIPGFAAPVREDLSESPKVPIISAFSKTTDSTTGLAAFNSTVPKGMSSNGTAGVETTSTRTSPLPVLTPAPEQKEDADEFWGAETESSTDVTEGSTAR
ncbi:mucin-1-like [Anopheles funestus]|uniref:mucin-1-like n=1 Tax=Anopheles funestus TaxID=62324 RepID=UPI0020C5E58D|nr:mucin-1-like [Anopheles funestus]